MSLHHGWGWYQPQTLSYIHIWHIQRVWAIGMLSQGHVGAPLYRYTGQVGTRFWDLGSLMERKWCHYVMVQADIYLRPFIYPYYAYKKCLSHWYAVLRACGCTLIPLHQPGLPQIWGFRFTCGVKMMSLRHGWGWYPPQTTSYIHIRHIQSFEPLVCCLKGMWVHPYTVTLAKLALDLGILGSLEEWQWCHNVMFGADIYLKPLHTSIVDIYNVF